jgi:hypothetical protein
MLPALTPEHEVGEEERPVLAVEEVGWVADGRVT